VRRPALALLLGCLLLVAGASALDGYDYYQTIEYAGCDQDIYQQDIVIHRTTGTAYNETAGGLETWHIYVGEHCREDYGDIRFANSSAELDYYLWPDYNSSSARFAVRLEGATSAGQMQVWYGNSAAATTSDGDATYIFFDQFKGSALDTEKWSNSGATGEVTVTGGEAIIHAVAGGAGNRYITSKPSFDGIGNFSVEIKAKHNPNGGNRAGVSIAAGRGDRWLYGAGVYGASFERLYALGHPIHNQYWYANSAQLSSTVNAETYNVFRFDIYQSNTRADYYANGVRAYQGRPITFNSFPHIELYIATWDSGNNPKLHVEYALVRAYSATPPAATTFSGEQETAAPPATAFTAAPTAGLAPLTVQFTDRSTGTPTAWSWSFGDGNTSTAQNPQHTYTAPGTYSVNLTATNEYGSTPATKLDYITVYALITAQFTANTTGGTAPVAVQFTDTSTGSPTSWAWTFGDGNTSTAQNPQHTYATAGTHTVTLTASHPYDSDTETKTAYITVAVLQPYPGLALIPRDLAGNGLYTDINGNNRLDYNDLTVFFQNLAWAKTAQPIACFDFNGNGWLDYNDVITLFSTIMEEHT